MDEDKFTQAYKDEQRRKDEAMIHHMHQLAFGSSSAGSILSAASITDASTFATTAATNLYATSTVGVVSAKPYYKKEVDDASLFMDNKLKIFAASLYATSSNNMHKLDDISAISLSSRYAITEYFNILYYDLLRAPGSKGKYEINDTNNVIKHLNLLTQTFENIAQYSGALPVGIIAHKWEILHKALIWLILKTH